MARKKSKTDIGVDKMISIGAGVGILWFFVVKPIIESANDLTNKNQSGYNPQFPPPPPLPYDIAGYK